MALNKAGNMYPGVETWNPLAGECPHRCSYCSTHSLMRYPVIKAKYSGPLRLDSCLYKKLSGKSKLIFVVAQNDLFAESVPIAFIKEILDQCNLWNQHTYLFQSKNPKRFFEFTDLFPENTILCTTIETNRRYSQMGNTPMPVYRSLAMALMSGFRRQITIEPVMDFDFPEMVKLIRQTNPESVNIGADSKGHHLPEPSKEKLLALIEELQKFTVIDKKTNLLRLLK